MLPDLFWKGGPWWCQTALNVAPLLEWANLDRSDFSFARLYGTNFAGAHIEQAQFIKAIIDEAEIFGLNGKSTGRRFSANFKQISLLGSNFAGAVLDHVDLSDSEHDQAQFKLAVIKDIVGL